MIYKKICKTQNVANFKINFVDQLIKPVRKETNRSCFFFALKEI